MKLEIFPSSIVIFPSDRQRFTARAEPPPAIWDSTINSTVQADGSLKANTQTSQSGFGGHEIREGIGQIEWQITNNCLPTGIGTFALGIRLQSLSAFHEYTAVIKPTQTEIYDGVGLITTISHTVAAGHVFRVEIAAASVALYINGVFKHRYSGFTGTAYPAIYLNSIVGPVVGSAMAVPAPVLSGNWQLRTNIAEWIAPSHGSITNTGNSIDTEYHTGTIPGVYTLTAEIDGANDGDHQKAFATIVILPLSILAENPVTLQPGEKVRFKTSYDNAQTLLVTWSVVSGGGSFTNGEYTASSSPGNSVIRATAGAQFNDLTVTVPTVVTASQAAAQPSEAITFNTNMTGSVTWSADYGTASGSGSTFIWTAPSQAGLTAKVKASNGTISRTLEMPVLLKFPFDDPALPLSWDRRKTVLVSRAEDRSRAARVKDKGGLPFESFELTFKNRTVAQLQSAHSFWDSHHPAKRFIFEDKLRSIRKVCYFDSDIRNEGNGRCGIDFSFRAVEG